MKCVSLGRCGCCRCWQPTIAGRRGQGHGGAIRQHQGTNRKGSGNEDTQDGAPQHKHGRPDERTRLTGTQMDRHKTIAHGSCPCGSPDGPAPDAGAEPAPSTWERLPISRSWAAPRSRTQAAASSMGCRAEPGHRRQYHRFDRGPSERDNLYDRCRRACSRVVDPGLLGVAVSDLTAAYNDAAGRTNPAAVYAAPGRSAD